MVEHNKNKPLNEPIPNILINWRLLKIIQFKQLKNYQD